MSFYNWHTHTHHSVFDSIIREQDLINFAKTHGHTAVMVSEHGTLSGSLAINKLCKENNLKYIPAMEAYFCDNINVQDDILYHLMFFAQTTEGYKNLCRLTSESHKYFYKKPRLDWTILKGLPLEGIGCTSACLGGFIKRDDYKQCFDRLIDIFSDNFYIELHCYGQSEQEKANRKAVAYAKERGIKMLVATDAHYLRAEDADTHRLWENIKKGSDYFPDNSLYLHTEEEAYNSCKGINDEIFADCIRNLGDIADNNTVTIGDGGKHYPKFPIDNADEELRRRTREGWKRLPANKKSKTYTERVQYELDVLTKLNYSNYFLIVDDMLQWCRKNDIPTGIGRGSCCGSLVCYLMEITRIDPIEFQIIFERFAHTDRISEPDLDTDISQLHRGKVIEYLKEKYGGIYNIRTFNTLKPKAAIKRACMALGYINKIPEIITTYVKDNLDDLPEKMPKELEAVGEKMYKM